MNSTDPQHPWARLTTAARHVRDDRDTTAPYGFATRVTAIAFASSRSSLSLAERFALRAVGVACVLAILSVAVNYSALTRPAAPVEETATDDDTVSLLLKVD
jgi:hypothetical protein